MVSPALVFIMTAMRTINTQGTKLGKVVIVEVGVHSEEAPNN